MEVSLYIVFSIKNGYQLCLVQWFNVVFSQKLFCNKKIIAIILHNILQYKKTKYTKTLTIIV